MRRLFIVLTFLLSSAAYSGEGVQAALSNASKLYNVSYELLSKIADLESGFDPKAQAKTASARGLFQIIRSTERGLKKQCGITGDIFDPNINALLAACGLSSNIKYLKRKLKRNPTSTEIYISHFMGMGNSYRFLRYKSRTKMAKYFRKQAKANTWIFYKRGKMRTKLEIYNLFKRKLEKARVL